LAVVIVTLLVTSFVGWQRGGATGSGAHASGIVRLLANGREIARVDLLRLQRHGRLDRAAVRRAVISALPPSKTLAVGHAWITYRLDRSRTATLVLAQADGGGTVETSRQAIASRVQAPVIAQALHNNCETAALSVVLATTGAHVSQLRLQSEVARSGPLDPHGTRDDRIWGDPELGFVGRANGGGVAGGFGVYQRPILALAARHDRTLVDVTAKPAAAIYRELLAGHAVMTWIGLSDGPYGSWLSPTGRHVHVNFGEHAVVLTGIDPQGRLSLVNPLYGTAERWSKRTFELMWQRLGRRALAA
jgi:uncharacterized protein YvpB